MIKMDIKYATGCQMQEQAKHWGKYYIPRNFLTGETERFNFGGASPLFGWAEYESEQIFVFYQLFK